jgi:hypothetical protein
MTVKITNTASKEAESFFARHAWKVLLGESILIGLFGVSDMFGGAADLQNGEKVFMSAVTGITWNELQTTSPGVTHLLDTIFRNNGASLVTVSLLSLAICLNSFRKGERWAWYALWAPPLWMLLTVLFTKTAVRYPAYGTPVPVISGSVLLTLWVVFHGLSFAKFFSKDRR